ncbi:hypothetical protein HDG38_003797 [Paraburkholderia sp. WSM4177]|nr:hypothetical protein [Paraburkholderia sp. WSM4177]MBB5485716.1 hypothetical protein [Paraburkholderia sp. WSM4180]
MDGNLLLAIVTKLLGPFLGPVAQTYGAWIYLCALLQLWAIYWALRQQAVSSVCAFLGTPLIGLSSHLVAQGIRRGGQREVVGRALGCLSPVRRRRDFVARLRIGRLRASRLAEQAKNAADPHRRLSDACETSHQFADVEREARACLRSRRAALAGRVDALSYRRLSDVTHHVVLTPRCLRTAHSRFMRQRVLRMVCRPFFCRGGLANLRKLPVSVMKRRPEYNIGQRERLARPVSRRMRRAILVRAHSIGRSICRLN